MTKFVLTILVVGLIVSSIFSYNTWYENKNLSLANIILAAENRLLKEDAAEYLSKPTYDQGYNDAFVRMGGPQNSGNFQDGWDSATKVLDIATYQEGYHAAIKQFGYIKLEGTRWLVPEPKHSSEEKIIQTKLEN